MEYDFRAIEQKWRKHWAENKTYQTVENPDKPKYYGLTMFPYPSGAGLHVGHPLGYIASDIYARYKRLKGFNVLHPMGYDSFGLPAEQYAIQTGQHPAITTKANVGRYREQLDKIGFSFDWDREVRTSDPNYYKWTQWIFKQIFESWYNKSTDKAEHIDTLIAEFEKNGNLQVSAVHDCEIAFSAEDWKEFDTKKQNDILMDYRLTYLADSWVNWCPALGTVLANDEVVNGVSERGGHPVEQKLMRQWSMRITAYAERLLQGLVELDWSDAIKDIQRNWIGKSVGASVRFGVENHENEQIEVFTTRPDTIFGVSFMVLAPEHELVSQITTAEYKEAVENYKKEAGFKSERDRMSDVKNVTGQFTGAYAVNPLNNEKIPIWIGDYVLASYGTGAVMAVPCGDQRDWDFAQKFDIPIKNVFEGVDISEGAYTDKTGTITNSDFLNGLPVKKAIKRAIHELEEKGIGKSKTNYRLRDAVFSRQRYWGEPFPVYYDNGVAKTIADEHLPIELPEVDKYLPTEDGQPPLGNATDWYWDTQKNELTSKEYADQSHVHPMELNTMPGWAGSSWYFLRYMDPHNETAFVSKEKVDYWKNVDLYIGGAEHATGHLLYARFWTKFLKDRGFINFEEPFQKMINQGMILGNSAFLYVLNLKVESKIRIKKHFENQKPYQVLVDQKLLSELKSNEGTFNDLIEKVTLKLKQKDDNLSLDNPDLKDLRPIHINVNLERQDGTILLDDLSEWIGKDFANYDIDFIDDQKFVLGHEVEKMSKSKYNVQTPDDLVEQYGADTLRMYEMFLGPLEQAKPWDTKGINGVHNFLRKLWRLFHDAEGNVKITEGEPDKKALKTLHKTIKKIQEDMDRYVFNTAVSAFMICVNELTEQKCNNKAILQDLVVLLVPYAPHIAEELWVKLGNEAGTVSDATFPEFNEEYLVENTFAYPVSFNGKMRFKAELPTNMSKEDVEKEVMAMEQAQKYLEGKTPKKVIVVPGRIVNVVV
ncbi:MAG: leucine--tRNA ligase [Crocinitomicaceae bacterium]|nr:leucine--tRNA ligase [Crocinitomicaceae bacterium]